jgi:succinate dehydrogenase/fumarate reductase flavoprotein subunit
MKPIIQKNVSGKFPWPYEVKYGHEIRDQADVLIIGGGLAGSFAAMHAARRGASVIIMEKGAVVRSGAAGAGIDHWMACPGNPGSNITAEEMMALWDKKEPFCGNHTMFICMKESYEALLDLEELGVQIRDVNDEFIGAPFRDEQSKLLYAYDYDNRHMLRIHGASLKKALFRELKRLGVKIYDRTMATCLLSEKGIQGSPVVGATGYNLRTGEFSVMTAKAVILATAKPLRLWEWGSDLVGSNSCHDDPNCAGDGNVMAWRAGAKMTLMERAQMTSGSRRYPAYGAGNSSNTWYPANIVDDVGKQIPYTNRDGNELKSVEERCRCHKGQRVMLPIGAFVYDHAMPGIAPDTPKRIETGEFKMPFFADLTTLPEYERRAIFGLMIGNEGKTKVPIYEKLISFGFDPERDMLMVASTVPVAAGGRQPSWTSSAPGVTDIRVREMAFFYGGGVIVDWKHRTSLENLFAVGNISAGSEGASGAAANGRYCGRNVASYIKERTFREPCERQIAAEKDRIYAPLKNTNGATGWKEVQLGLCRLMQEYLGKYKTEETMRTGLWWFNSVRENELSMVTVSNPHELGRLLETEFRLSVGEIILQSSLARKASSSVLDFNRIDYPQNVKWEDDMFIGIWQVGGKPRTEKMSLRYWNDNGKTYAENYADNCGKERLRNES